MNFLSHYYFDRKNPNSYEILGCLLPDLVKNADRKWNIYPEKLPYEIYQNPAHTSLLKGWKKHLLVDKLFHSSDYFNFHQHQLKLEVKDILEQTLVKPFFLAHIAVELLLDSLLITHLKLKPITVYDIFKNTNEQEVVGFLKLNHIEDIQKFLKFYHLFIKEEYLLSYQSVEKIAYSLKRICMRIWPIPFPENQELALTEILMTYKNILAQDFIFIFDSISSKLDNHS